MTELVPWRFGNEAVIKRGKNRGILRVKRWKYEFYTNTDRNLPFPRCFFESVTVSVVACLRHAGFGASEAQHCTPLSTNVGLSAYLDLIYFYTVRHTLAFVFVHCFAIRTAGATHPGLRFCSALRYRNGWCDTPRPSFLFSASPSERMVRHTPAFVFVHCFAIGTAGATHPGLRPPLSETLYLHFGIILYFCSK